MPNKDSHLIKIENRRAYHDYFVLEKYEAGIELVGTEVKSIRCGGVNLSDGYCDIDGGEMFLLNVRVSPYEKGNIFNIDPNRPRRLLLHKREILKLGYAKSKDGYTIIPLALYFSGRNVKAEIGVCKGKKLYDKRESIADRDMKRRAERE